MKRGNEAELLEDDCADLDLLCGIDGLISRGTSAEKVRRQFDRAECVWSVLFRHGLILGIAGEVEDADVKPLLVEAIGNDGQIKAIHADDAVLVLPAKSLLVAWGAADVLLAPRYDDDVR